MKNKIIYIKSIKIGINELFHTNHHHISFKLNKKTKNKFFKFFLFWIFLIILYINNINRELILNLKLNREYIKLKSYLLLCNEGILINKKKFKKVVKPKISIITSIYNRAKFILRFLRSIQNQFFDNIEILFIDDGSKDNSTDIIEYYKNQDERIILLKLKKNKGTLIARNIGVIFSKGDYIIIPDSDDILSNTILKICYKLSIRYKYEMIRFNQYEENSKGYWMKVFNEFKTYEIYQPELSTFIFYGLGNLQLHDFSISNKFIKRELFIKALNSINQFYLTQYMIGLEDGLINFSLHRNAKSLYLLNKLGYYYTYNNKSITRIKKKKRTCKYRFLYLKFLYENTRNTLFEKNMAFSVFNRKINKINNVNLITNEFEFYNDILITYLNNKYNDNLTKMKLIKMIEFIKMKKKHYSLLKKIID